MPNVSDKYTEESYAFPAVYPIDQSIIRHNQIQKIYPFTGTKRVICPPKLFTRSEILATSLDASKPNQSPFSSITGEVLEIVYIILPTMLCLEISFVRVVDELDFDLGI